MINNINREIFVNRIIDSLNIIQSFSPKIVYSISSNALLFEYINHIELNSIDDTIINKLLISYIKLQNLVKTISFFDKVILNLTTSGLYLSSITLLIRNYRSYRGSVLKILGVLYNLNSKKITLNEGVIHKDLTRNKNYCYNGDNVFINDLEQIYIENKWVLYDIVIIAFDIKSLTVNMNILKLYIKNASLKINIDELKIHVRFSLLRYCLGASIRIPQLQSLLKEILIKNDSYNTWVNEQL